MVVFVQRAGGVVAEMAAVQHEPGGTAEREPAHNDEAGVEAIPLAMRRWHRRQRLGPTELDAGRADRLLHERGLLGVGIRRGVPLVVIECRLIMMQVELALAERE